MKKLATVTLICLTLTIATEIAHAQQSGVGFGAVINGPTGISYKAWVDDRVAIGGALTFTLGDGPDSFYTHADVQIHSKNLFSSENPMPASLNFYYGGGVALTVNNQNIDENVDLRAVLGTTYGFEDAPVDLFFELAPSLRLTQNTRYFFNGALGFRYYLN